MWAKKLNGLLPPLFLSVLAPSLENIDQVHSLKVVMEEMLWRRKWIPHKCRDVALLTGSLGLGVNLLKGSIETGLFCKSVSLNATSLTPSLQKIAETIICMFSPYEELTENMSVARACICAITPAVCVYLMHLCTKVLAKGINTMKAKIMNSDSSRFILSESEQEYAVASTLILNYIFRDQPLRGRNCHLEFHWVSVCK